MGIEEEILQFDLSHQLPLELPAMQFREIASDCLSGRLGKFVVRFLLTEDENKAPLVKRSVK